ncbi:histone deacetylase family protein [Mucisphaera calidilacus]|uniref:Histone deacetylase-like amidohydrolase n=1 Tax=Mucisphaera calidilacus TaxID=2527982 RepID=A0A518BW74_9BACT|nr:histone deacetylase [Mucisphaera calidilacus]QDU71230.1 Histone deacetylase-like amidohydrolase [Mucisphaera calidilacus]
MGTGLIYSERFLEHRTGPGHPERVERLSAIVERLRKTHQWDEVQHLAFKPADRKWIDAMHDPAYVDRVFEICRDGGGQLDEHAGGVCSESADIARLAVGGVLRGCDAVMEQEVHNALCLVRPPGHHAERDRSMGFCLFGNVAIAANYLTRAHGIKRVLVIDWDVHHGNGTQHMTEDRADIFCINLHQHPMTLYPGTGYAHERGSGAAEGLTLNLPLDPHANDERYRAVWMERVEPAIREFVPQFILISAGFDAGIDDPLASMNVTTDGFRWMTRQTKTLAEEFCRGRLVSVLEGGYDLRSLAENVSVHLRALMREEQQDGLMAMKAGF